MLELRIKFYDSKLIYEYKVFLCININQSKTNLEANPRCNIINIFNGKFNQVINDFFASFIPKLIKVKIWVQVFNGTNI